MIYNPTEGLWRKFGNPPCSWPGFVVLIVGGGGAGRGRGSRAWCHLAGTKTTVAWQAGAELSCEW